MALELDGLNNVDGDDGRLMVEIGVERLMLQGSEVDGLMVMTRG